MKAARHLSCRRVLVFVALGFLIAPASAQQLQVESSVVDSGFFYYYDLSVDLDGNAHAFYDNTLTDRLYYNSNVGGAWGTPEFIHTTSDIGSTAVSGGVDHSGVSHIAYDSGMGGNDVFTYATDGTGSWWSDVVRTTSRWYSLDLSPIGDLHVAYYYDYGGLHYATMGDASWFHETVDSSGQVTAYAGRYPDLVVDDEDYGYIVYYFYAGGEDDVMRYATNRSGSWEWEDVVQYADSRYGELALDADGEALVAYVQNGRIWLAERQGGAWDPTPVTDVGSHYYCDLDTDDDGTAYVVYNDGAANKLMLAVEQGGSFVHFEMLDSSAGGSGPILHVQDGVIHVLAWNQGTEELLYLRGSLTPPGDLNGDGCVDQADLGILLGDWNCTGGDCPGDADGDGDTDQADLGVLLGHWGEGC